ncbi:lysylphosphatidylglycerol synthase domain-containing protein [Amphritea sp. 2_MG-2023]|uniref:lysylphosphatidylglycerol synthase domain-containing protein n=1 Tax=Amphritea TaxID=515417 RepID=UPI001C0684E0|nr:MULTISPECIES: lysylphosphatidylglycerol synthase domain-containing protein [Amphritea]MBU2967576.1 flippase-like domain-containing protein [Amphritea atlantica]MDO6419064.1 lysylphosphatidylglycerol synthase domain-containing protein [Amphritea sp. 2_MG-2023]
MRRAQLLKLLLSVVILFITLAVVEYQIGWYNLLTSWQGFSGATLALLVVLSLASNALRALRIKVSFALPASRYPQMFYLSTNHNLLNNLLPMRTGEVAFPVLIKRYFGIGVVNSSSHLLLYRLLDLVALLSVAGILALWQFSPWASLGLALVTVVGLLLFNQGKRLVVWLLGHSNSAKLATLAQAFHDLPTRGGHFGAIVITTYAVWLTKLLAFLGVVLQLSQLTLAQAVTSVAVADLSSILPIHGVAGSGTFEAAFVLAGQFYTIDTTALLKVAVQLHLFLLLMSFIAFGLGWLVAKIFHHEEPLQATIERAVD